MYARDVWLCTLRKATNLWVLRIVFAGMYQTLLPWAVDTQQCVVFLLSI